MEVNYFGTVAVTKKFLPQVKKFKGRIINVASIVGRYTFPGTSAYSASKYAVQSFTDSLRCEMRVWNVKVIMIEPGVTKTPLFEDFIQKTDKEFNQMPESVQLDYGKEFFEDSAIKLRKGVQLLGGNPENVIDAMVQATICKWPKSRYIIGKDTFIFVIFGLLPSFVSDTFSVLIPTLRPKVLQKK